MTALYTFILLLAVASKAHAVSLDRLSTAWNSLGELNTLGLCQWNSSQFCKSNSQSKGNSLSGGVLLSATESVLDITNSMQKKTIDSGEVNKLFEKGNYSDLLLAVDLNVKAKSFTLGIKPIRYSGSFQLHNPNLPYVSLIFRDDTIFYFELEKNIEWKNFEIQLQSHSDFQSRESTLVECSTTELASRPAKDLLQSSKEKQIYWNPSLFIKYKKNLRLGLQLKNYPLLKSPLTPLFSNSLFINNDRDLYIQYGISQKISLSFADFFASLGLFQFQKIKNKYSEQWFSSGGMQVGPLKLVLGFRPELIRSALEIQYAIFHVGVGQEWKNRLELGRDAQPRFTLSIGANL
jgi:hypothetical protein